MVSNDSKAFKSGIWYTISNFLVRSIGLITTPIFTRLLSKTEFGLYSNFISWLAILTVVITLNLESTLISARYDYEDRFDDYIFSVLMLSSLTSAIWIIILNVFSTTFVDLFGINQVYINIMSVYLFFLPAVNLFQARERYYFKYKKTVLISTLLTVGAALLSVVLILYMPNRLTGRILGSTIPTILVGLILFGFFWKKKTAINISYWKYALPTCLPYIPHLLSLNLLNSIDRVMITRICGVEDTALYSLAYTCGSLVTMLGSALNSAFSPWLGEKMAYKQYKDVRKFSYKYILGFVYLAIGIILLAPEILDVLGGETYMDAIWVMPPVAVGCIFQFMYMMFVNVEQFSKKTVGMAFASITAALINYGLNYLLIPKYGYVAAAYTTLVGYMWLLFVHMILVYKLGFKNIYNYVFMLVVSGFSLLIALTCNIIYTVTVVRYVILCIFGAIFFIIIVKNKDSLKKLV
jgi:O-antigen/teichoic acid export membrane protein